MTEPLVAIRDVSFAYNGQLVLENIQLDVGLGDFIAMIGPNGGGKTTLLKLILGLLKPDKGQIRVLGQTPQKASPMIGYVPQNVSINSRFPITAIDVVLMGRLGSTGSGNSVADRREAMAALERLDMGAMAQQRIGALSGGQRQRVFIARALVTRPKLLLLDEPTASIDTKGQAEFYAMLKQLNQDVTIVVVSHDLLVISAFVKSVACVNKGLHHHQHGEITGEMIQTLYPCTVEQVCPVEMVVHALSRRINTAKTR